MWKMTHLISTHQLYLIIMAFKDNDIKPMSYSYMQNYIVFLILHTSYSSMFLSPFPFHISSLFNLSLPVLLPQQQASNGTLQDFDKDRAWKAVVVQMAQ